jgi:hypothetical protein
MAGSLQRWRWLFTIHESVPLAVVPPMDGLNNELLFVIPAQVKSGSSQRWSQAVAEPSALNEWLSIVSFTFCEPF